MADPAGPESLPGEVSVGVGYRAAEGSATLRVKPTLNLYSLKILTYTICQIFIVLGVPLRLCADGALLPETLGLCKGHRHLDPLTRGPWRYVSLGRQQRRFRSPMLPVSLGLEGLPRSYRCWEWRKVGHRR